MDYVLRYLLLSVMLVVGPAAVWAEQSVVEPQFSPLDVSVPPVSATPSFSRRAASEFSQGLLLSDRGEFGEASIVFDKLRDRLNEAGYKNASGFSHQLLSRVVERKGDDDSAGAQFFLRQALLFSPSDPGVLLEASSDGDLLGWQGSFSLLVRAFVEGLRSPFSLLILLGSCLLLVSSGLTITLLFFFGAQLSRVLLRARSLFDSSRPTWKRCFQSGSVLFLAIAPMYIGLLPTLVIWAMLLGYFWGYRSKLILAVASVTLLWAGVTAMDEQFGSLRLEQSPANVIRIYSADFTVSDIYLAESQQELFPWAQLAQGIVQMRGGDYDKAILNLREVASSPSEELRATGAAMLGIAYYHREQYADALKQFDTAQKIMGESFPLLYNTSLAALKALDTDRSRSVYDRMSAEYPSETKAALAHLEKEQLLDIPVPWDVQVSALRSVSEDSQAFRPVQMLLTGTALSSFELMLVALLLVVYTAVAPQTTLRMFGRELAQEVSVFHWLPVWHWFEAGNFAQACIVGAGLASMLLVVTQQPVWFHSVSGLLPAVLHVTLLFGMVVTLLFSLSPEMTKRWKHGSND